MDFFDVVVAGGGSAGVAAALSAARTGARTLLLERCGYAGGAGTASLVHTFCGMFLPGAGDSPVYHPGIPEEFGRRMVADGVARGPVRIGRVHVLLHDPHALAAWYDRLCIAQPYLTVRYHTEVTGAVVCDSRVTALETLCRGVRGGVSAGAFVDATGDAVLAEYCDSQWTIAPPEALQRPAYIVQISGVDANVLENDGALALAGFIGREVAGRRLPPECAGAHFRPGVDGASVYLTLDLPGDSEGRSWNPLDPASLTALEQTGRRTVLALMAALRSGQRGFSRAYPGGWPARAGIRESRRWRTRYELTEDDILRGAQFADAVATVAWPIELRETARGAKMVYADAGRPAGIPLRSLQPPGLENLFAAGRCIGASHRAHASVRVMGTALATGQAAGAAAALVAAGSPGNLADPVRKLTGAPA